MRASPRPQALTGEAEHGRPDRWPRARGLPGDHTARGRTQAGPQQATSGPSHTTASVSPSATGPATPTSPVPLPRAPHGSKHRDHRDGRSSRRGQAPPSPPPAPFRGFLSQEAVRPCAQLQSRVRKAALVVCLHWERH
uniref:Uncharacterized protein n=1 Tax=Myotis myotis TaxID=51298 RepID=A0A7J7R1U5_MYOMY|nr:hypothetical protein mMyoMyo1_011222 [Myotis myotis]